MASGSNYLTTYYAKRIIGDSAAANRISALLQTGENIEADTWILSRTNRVTDYGIKYIVDASQTIVPAEEEGGTPTQVANEHDKIQFIGKGNATAWVQLDTGDFYVAGKVGIGYNPNTSGNTYQLYVDGTTCINNNTDIKGSLIVDIPKGTPSHIIARASGYTNNANLDVKLIIGTGAQNHGVYSTGYSTDGTTFTSDAKWIVYRNKDGNIFLNGNADTATALTSNAGDGEQPIYFTGGKPSATTYALKATVNNGTAGRLVYYSDDRAISSTTNIHALNNYLLASSRNNVSVDIRANGLIIWGQTYGNTANQMISNTAGVFRFGDGGPQIVFNSSNSWNAQAGALIFTDHDTAGTGVSFHFVTTESSNNTGGSCTVTAPIFKARKNFDGPLIHSAAGVNYISGAKGNNATVYAKKATGSVWRPAVCLQTSGGGAWQIGNYNDETLEFQYATKANIDSQTNTTSEIYMQNGDTGRVITTGNYTSWCATSEHNHDSTYLKLSGGTMTGALHFANNTLNNVGDDCAMGDQNVAGALCIKGKNGATNIRFIQYNGTAAGTVSWDGSRFGMSAGLTITANTYPSLRLTRTDAGEQTIYLENNTAGWAIGVAPWSVGAGQFAIGQYSGTGSSAWRFRIDNKGYCYTRSYLNLGAGNEKNNSSPSYVAGFNSSDNYVRSYNTSYLNVNSATYATYQNCVATNEIRYNRNGNMASANDLWQGWAFAEGKVAVINSWKFGNGNGGLAPIYGSKVYNAVWNDFAEYRESEEIEGGRVLVSDGTGKLIRSTERLQPAARVISDTFGCSVGQSDTAKTPIGVAGRVLVYPYQDRKNYKVGDALCAAPNGTADIMTREEIIQYPDRIIGIVDEIPEYEIWDQVLTNVKYEGGEVGEQNHTLTPVNGRIWIYVK